MECIVWKQLIFKKLRYAVDEMFFKLLHLSKIFIRESGILTLREVSVRSVPQCAGKQA
jgi:hypothetical protein